MSFATSEQTRAFASKFSHYKDFYQEFDGLLYSKLGIGTFIKEPYKEENYTFNYKSAIKEAIKNGINVIDTASNYRYGESERDIGKTLKELIDKGEIKREELIISSKGGFIQLDYPFPKNPYHWIEKNIIKNNLATKDEILLDQHCINPKYLEFSLDKTLQNLGIPSIDIYYLHNPEMQLGDISYEELLVKIEEIFKLFEKFVSEGKIKYYGIATWNGFLNDKGSVEYLSLQDLVDIAYKVGGENHKFKFIQAPFNLAKTSMITKPNQTLKDNLDYTLIQASYKLGVNIISSSSLLQMNLFKKSFSPEVGYVLDKDMKLSNDVQLALQFNRSTNGILCSLFGSKEPKHIEENVKISAIKAIKKSQYNLLFRL